MEVEAGAGAWYEWSGVSALDPHALLENAPRMELMRARIEADHPEPLGRTTYMRATTVAVARPVGSMLQTVELMGSLQACYLVITPSTPSRLSNSWDRCRHV